MRRAGFSVEGPSQAEVHCADNDDGCVAVTYLPAVAGEYAVHVLCDDEDIADSPFIVHVHPPPAAHFDPYKVSPPVFKPRLHDTTGCQTGCTTGLTTGCIV